MHDTIHLNNIRAWGRHGVSDEERQSAQELTAEITMQVDLQQASTSDDLNDTVDYSKVYEQAVKIIESTSYRLLERIGGHILAEHMRDSRICSASITLSKPNLLNGATPSVTVTARRP